MRTAEFMRSNRECVHQNQPQEGVYQLDLWSKMNKGKKKCVETDKNVPFHTHMMTIVCPPTSKSDTFKD